MAYCYILRSERSGRFYVGHAEDVERRLADHLRGHVVSTRGKGPWEIVHVEKFTDRAAACAREREIKSWKSATRISELCGLERPAKREGR